ncbi:hypothetical protein [Ferrovibrio sp.]|uniref:hypothetical protein n=1 Tax=Ferrovibrio sp. TaxID=1917215 RepID=UPI000CC9B8A3|nr:hypothetical protein [Ferrovibrio sp.]PJI40412.1 MAG: hypothetical protein CTR53_10400 [Ferrovibrio sp.]
MKFPILKRMSQDDFRTAPKWFDAVLSIINPIIDFMNQSMPNGLNIDDNLEAEVQVITAKHATTKTVRLNKLKRLPRFMRTGYAGGQVVVGAQIVRYGTNTVDVRLLFEGAPTGEIKVTVCFEP